MSQPLSGVRVIDLTRIIAGPFCTMLLADLGADVVKVEPIGSGDAVRQQGYIKDGLSWYYAQFNRNKRSIALDLRSDGGKHVLAELISSADVLVENFRPGVLADMGFSDERLRELNPGLVVGSVNGFGSTGPYRDRPSFDFIAQAMSGFMSVTGEADGPPMRAGPPIADLVAGLYCALGVVSALRVAEKTGAGQRIESAMMSGLMSLLAFFSADYLASGHQPQRTGNDHPIAAPYGLFHCADGDLAVAPSTHVILSRFLEALGLSDILSRPEYATAPLRHARRKEIAAMVNDRMRTDTQENWLARLNAAGVPCGKVLSLEEVLSDPQMRDQEMILDVPHDGFGTVRMTGFPMKFSTTPCKVRHPAPRLGEHTDEILAEAGFSSADIDRLKSDRVV